MKSLLPVAAAALLVLNGLATGTAMAAPTDDAKNAVEAQSAEAPPPPPLSANEQAGLPNLDEINRPAAKITSKVEFNQPRTPSFHEVSPNGTEITEYRDKGKPVEINVRSNFGTHYTMTAPADTSPQVRTSGQASERLPSINLHY
ncbi:hypothetical protein [Paraburkholderia ferrariae]|uniref:hypothetical protein n=1 Tax=Paraburkholderia ferrariae TaxID=386056 RepID=UPI0004878368|nr:hypothetical protein [Paraburkholderia ferrariae]